MNASPDYVNLETGEIVDLDLSQGNRSPLDIARSQLAGFKFATLDTVRADPRLRKAPCLSVMSVYLSFVTIDKRTLKPTTAYASNIELMARCNDVNSKVTAGKARRLLVENGYLVLIGQTKDGCAKYRVENPHIERVQMHIQEAKEYWKGRDAEQKEDERRKKRFLGEAGVTTDVTPQGARGNIEWSDRVTTDDTNYLIGNLSGLSSREESPPIKVSSVSSSYAEIEEDPHLPYPIPESEQELMFMLSSLFDGCQLSAEIMQAMRKMLMAGKLTPAMVEEQRRFAS